jgi:hypothetical protein
LDLTASTNFGVLVGFNHPLDFWLAWLDLTMIPQLGGVVGINHAHLILAGVVGFDRKREFGWSG